ncbi:MAG TPA: copper chaperone PCu(A)C [Roseiarcus sp.]|nr:copper chaperone PCu(A)C [Roseiarcus sp.]
MRHFRSFALAAALAFAAAPAFAQQFKVGDLVIEQPWTRATPKGASVAAGYLTIRNNGTSPDKLLGGSADFAETVQIHEMSNANGVMKMRRIDGLEIPAKGGVTLKPNGVHLMFQGLKRPLVAGQTVKATLTFEHAGSAPVEFKIGGMGAMKPAGDSMGGMKM